MTPAPTIQIIDVVSSGEDKSFAPAGRMAAAIIEIIQENGGCLPQDLNAKGFTADEVAEHWHLAKSLADVEMKLMREQPEKAKSIFRTNS